MNSSQHSRKSRYCSILATLALTATLLASRNTSACRWVGNCGQTGGEGGGGGGGGLCICWLEFQECDLQTCKPTGGSPGSGGRVSCVDGYWIDESGNIIGRCFQDSGTGGQCIPGVEYRDRYGTTRTCGEDNRPPADPPKPVVPPPLPPGPNVTTIGTLLTPNGPVPKVQQGLQAVTCNSGEGGKDLHLIQGAGGRTALVPNQIELPTPQGSNQSRPVATRPGTGDPVTENGASIIDNEVLAIPGILPYSLHYRSDIDFQTPYGFGWNFEYAQRIVELNTSYQSASSCKPQHPDLMYVTARMDQVRFAYSNSHENVDYYTTDPALSLSLRHDPAYPRTPWVLHDFGSDLDYFFAKDFGTLSMVRRRTGDAVRVEWDRSSWKLRGGKIVRITDQNGNDLYFNYASRPLPQAMQILDGAQQCKSGGDTFWDDPAKSECRKRVARLNERTFEVLQCISRTKDQCQNALAVFDYEPVLARSGPAVSEIGVAFVGTGDRKSSFIWAEALEFDLLSVADANQHVTSYRYDHNAPSFKDVAQPNNPAYDYYHYNADAHGAIPDSLLLPFCKSFCDSSDPNVQGGDCHNLDICPAYLKHLNDLRDKRCDGMADPRNEAVHYPEPYPPPRTDWYWYVDFTRWIAGQPSSSPFSKCTMYCDAYLDSRTHDNVHPNDRNPELVSLACSMLSQKQPTTQDGQNPICGSTPEYSPHECHEANDPFNDPCNCHYVREGLPSPEKWCKYEYTDCLNRLFPGRQDGLDWCNDCKNNCLHDYRSPQGSYGYINALAHNLIQVIDADGRQVVLNKYGYDQSDVAFDKVVWHQQGVGNDSTMTFGYYDLAPTNPNVLDPNDPAFVPKLDPRLLSPAQFDSVEICPQQAGQYHTPHVFSGSAAVQRPAYAVITTDVGSVVTIAYYDAHWNPIREIDGSGRRIDRNFSAYNDRLAAVKDSTGARTCIAQNFYGNPTEVVRFPNTGVQPVTPPRVWNIEYYNDTQLIKQVIAEGEAGWSSGVLLIRDAWGRVTQKGELVTPMQTNWTCFSYNDDRATDVLVNGAIEPLNAISWTRPFRLTPGLVINRPEQLVAGATASFSSQLPAALPIGDIGTIADPSGRAITYTVTANGLKFDGDPSSLFGNSSWGVLFGSPGQIIGRPLQAVPGCGNQICELGEEQCSDCYYEREVSAPPNCGNESCDSEAGEDFVSCPGDCTGHDSLFWTSQSELRRDHNGGHIFSLPDSDSFYSTLHRLGNNTGSVGRAAFGVDAQVGSMRTVTAPGGSITLTVTALDDENGTALCTLAGSPEVIQSAFDGDNSYLWHNDGNLWAILPGAVAPSSQFALPPLPPPLVAPASVYAGGYFQNPTSVSSGAGVAGDFPTPIADTGPINFGTPTCSSTPPVAGNHGIRDRIPSTIVKPDQSVVTQNNLTVFGPGGVVVDSLGADPIETYFNYDPLTGVVKDSGAIDRANGQPRVGGSTHAQYELDGRQSSVSAEDLQGGLPITSTFQYDNSHHATKVIGPTSTRTITVDALGNPQTIVDQPNAPDPHAAPRTSCFLYDIHGRLLEQISPEGGAEKYVYNLSGQPLEVWKGYENHKPAWAAACNPVVANNPNSMEKFATYHYASSGLLNKMSSGDIETHFEYDGFGRLIDEYQILETTDVQGHPFMTKARHATQGYDALGRVAWQAVSGPEVYHFITKPQGKDSNLQSMVEMQYDLLGRVTQTNEWCFAQKGAQQDCSNGHRITAIAYDDAHDAATITDPEGKRTVTALDGAGRVLTQAQAAGTASQISATYVYAGSGTQVTKTVSPQPTPSGQLQRTLQYNAHGQLALVKDENAATLFEQTYDHLGLPAIATTLGTGRRETKFDAYGRGYSVAQRTEANLDSTRLSSYDRNDRLTLVTDAKNNTTKYTYDGVGRTVALVNGLGTTKYSYTPGSARFQTVVAPAGPGPIAIGTQHYFSYDVVGALSLEHVIDGPSLGTNSAESYRTFTHTVTGQVEDAIIGNCPHDDSVANPGQPSANGIQVSINNTWTTSHPASGLNGLHVGDLIGDPNQSGPIGTVTGVAVGDEFSAAAGSSGPELTALTGLRVGDGLSAEWGTLGPASSEITGVALDDGFIMAGAAGANLTEISGLALGDVVTAAGLYGIDPAHLHSGSWLVSVLVTALTLPPETLLGHYTLHGIAGDATALGMTAPDSSESDAVTVTDLETGQSETWSFSNGLSITVYAYGTMTVQDLIDAATSTTNQMVAVSEPAIVSAIDGSHAAPGTYAFSSTEAGTITLSNASGTLSQTLSVSDIAAGSTETLNFSTLGISITIHAISSIYPLSDLIAYLESKTIIGSDLGPPVSGVNPAFLHVGSWIGGSLVTAINSLDPLPLGQYTLHATATGSNQVYVTNPDSSSSDPIAVSDLATGYSEILTFGNGLSITLYAYGPTTTQTFLDGLTTETSPNRIVDVVHPAQISAVDGSHAVPGAYAFSSTEAGSITLSNAGGTLSQTLSVSDIAAGSTVTLSFSTLGISITVRAVSSNYPVSDLIANLTARTLVARDLGKPVPGLSPNSLHVGSWVGSALVTAMTSLAALPLGQYTLHGGTGSQPQLSMSNPDSTNTEALTIADLPVGHDQSLSFDNGLSITLHAYGAMTAAELWTALIGESNPNRIIEVVNPARVSALDGSQAAPGIYSFSSSGPGQITLGTSANGETLTVSDIGAGGQQTLHFSTLGISLAVQSVSSTYSADNLIANLITKTLVGTNLGPPVPGVDPSSLHVGSWILSAMVTSINQASELPHGRYLVQASTDYSQLWVTNPDESSSDAILVSDVRVGGDVSYNFSNGLSITFHGYGDLSGPALLQAWIGAGESTRSVLITAPAIVTAVDSSQAATGTYTFSSPVEGLLTLSSSYGAAETVPVSDIAPGSTATLDFALLGISITVRSVSSDYHAANLVSNLVERTLHVNNAIGSGLVSSAIITALDGTNAAPGTYTFSSNTPGSLTLSSANANETISYYDLAPNSSETLNFSSLGITLTLQAGQAGITAATIIQDLQWTPLERPSANSTSGGGSGGGGNNGNGVGGGNVPCRPEVIVHREYDSLGRTLLEQNNWVPTHVEHSYSDGLGVTALKPSAGSPVELHTLYDDLYRVTRVNMKVGQGVPRMVAQMGYSVGNGQESGALQSILSGNFVNQTLTYDSRLRVSSVEVTHDNGQGPVSLAKLVNGYGFDGIVRERQRTIGNAAPLTDLFKVDLAGRVVAENLKASGVANIDPGDLTNASVDAHWDAQTPSSSYTLDAVGNWTQRTSQNGLFMPMQNSDFTKANGYQAFDSGQGKHAVKYDSDGNVRSYETDSYKFNGLGWIEAATANGVTKTFGYDALGRRYLESSGGAWNYFVWDGNRIVATIPASPAAPQGDESQARIRVGVGSDDTLALVDGFGQGDVHYIHAGSDGVTPLIATDGNSEVVESYEFSSRGDTKFATPNGGLSDTSVIDNRFLYRGQLYDTGLNLYSMRAREYNPRWGRFLSTDPIGLAGGTNLYDYVGQQTLSMADPSGLCGQSRRVTNAMDFTEADIQNTIRQTNEKLRPLGDAIGLGTRLLKVAGFIGALLTDNPDAAQAFLVPSPYDDPYYQPRGWSKFDSHRRGALMGVPPLITLPSRVPTNLIIGGAGADTPSVATAFRNERVYVVNPYDDHAWLAEAAAASRGLSNVEVIRGDVTRIFAPGTQADRVFTFAPSNVPTNSGRWGDLRAPEFDLGRVAVDFTRRDAIFVLDGAYVKADELAEQLETFGQGTVIRVPKPYNNIPIAGVEEYLRSPDGHGKDLMRNNNAGIIIFTKP